MFLIWMISSEDEEVIAACGRFTELMTKFDAFAIRIRSSLSGKTLMILQAVMHKYCCPNRVYESTCMISLAIVVAKKGVQDDKRSVFALVTSTTCSCYSVSIVNTLLSVASVAPVNVPFSFNDSATIYIDTGCEWYGSIFIFGEKLPFTKLSIKNVPNRTAPLRS